MSKKFGIILFILLGFFVAEPLHAQTTSSGFVPGSIWYSKDPFEEGDKIKIYTFIFNPNKTEIKGTVNFFDKSVLLGKKDFLIGAESADDVFIHWTVTVGNHSIYAKIENAQIRNAKGVYEKVSLKDIQTKPSARTISKKITGTDAKGEPVQTETEPAPKDSATLKNIQDTIYENTPAFISKPIITFTNSLENSRIAMHEASSQKKTEVQQDLDELGINKGLQESNIFLKPFKYLELFVVTLFTFVVGSQIAFYIALLILIFLVVRAIWNRFL